MDATVNIIIGKHNGCDARVTFTRISAKIWNATIECGGRRVDVRSFKNTGLRPCPTHASLLLDEHFPKTDNHRRAALNRRDVLRGDRNARRLARQATIRISEPTC
jgi:hypothetical protein